MRKRRDLHHRARVDDPALAALDHLRRDRRDQRQRTPNVRLNHRPGLAAITRDPGQRLNAGASIQALTWVAGDRGEARAVVETNVWSPLALVAAVAPQMVERGEGGIVNTSSMVQVAPFPHLGHYCASRAALASITQTLQLELGPRGVRVVEVALGAVDTAGSSENRVLRGGAQWLDGRPGLGNLHDAARALV